MYHDQLSFCFQTKMQKNYSLLLCSKLKFVLERLEICTRKFSTQDADESRSSYKLGGCPIIVI